jgi:hypothetical protein
MAKQIAKERGVDFPGLCVAFLTSSYPKFFPQAIDEFVWFVIHDRNGRPNFFEAAIVSQSCLSAHSPHAERCHYN